MKKIISLLLALCLLASVTAIGEGAAYPMETDVTLKIYTTIFGDNTNLGYTDCNERPITQYVNEATGINAVWETQPAGSDANQIMNTMIASGSLTEYDIVISSTFNGSNADLMLEDEVIIPLNDYMDQLPAYTAYFESVPALEKKSRTDDGEYYALYCMRESGWANTYVGPLVRQDWLDALGLATPATFEDWDNVLRAFNETYGAKFTSTLSRVNIAGLSGAFDAFGSFSLTRYLDNDGKVQIGQAQPEWKEYVSALNNWYNEGLIDPDLLTNDDNAVRSKALNEETGLIILNLGSVDTLNNQAAEAGLNAQWVGIPYPVDDEGVCPWIQGNPDVTAENYSAVITTGCSDEALPVALAWLNFAYTEDGFNTWNFGKEGESFEFVDGQPKYTDNIVNSEEGISNTLFRVTGTVGSYWPVQAESLVRQKNSEHACSAVDQWLMNSTIEQHVVPNAALTQEETDAVTDIANSLSTYISEQSLKFFTGERSLDEFDTFVTELNKIGMPTYLEIYQGAVDRYNAK